MQEIVQIALIVLSLLIALTTHQQTVYVLKWSFHHLVFYYTSIKMKEQVLDLLFQLTFS